MLTLKQLLQVRCARMVMHARVGPIDAATTHAKLMSYKLVRSLLTCMYV